jgi:hypothetical protein
MRDQISTDVMFQRTYYVGCVACGSYTAGVDVRSLTHAATGGNYRIADGAVAARGAAVRVEIIRGIHTGLSTA